MYRQLCGFNAAGSTSGSFIDRLRMHDNDAWSHFVDIYGAIAFSRYVQAGVDEDLADELTQQVLFNVVSQIRDFEPESFRAWLWTIAKRRLIDHVRNAAKPVRAMGGSHAIQRLEQLSLDEDWLLKEELQIAIQLFHRVCDAYSWPDTDRKTILTYWSGTLTGQQAADEIGIKPATFYKRVSRLLRDIREFGE